MLFDHEATLHETDAMFTRSGPFPGKCLPDQAPRKCLHAFVVLWLRRKNGMEVPVTYMSNNASLDMHFCQYLLCIRDQFWQMNERYGCISDGKCMAWMSIDDGPVELYASLSGDVRHLR